MSTNNCSTDYCKKIHDNLYRKFNDKRTVEEYFTILHKELKEYNKPWVFKVFSSSCIYDGAIYTKKDGFNHELENLVKNTIESNGEFIFKKMEYFIHRPIEYDFSRIDVDIHLERKKPNIKIPLCLMFD